MRWHFERINGQPHKRVIRVEIEAPLFDNEEPPEDVSGICPGVSFFRFQIENIVYRNLVMELRMRRIIFCQRKGTLFGD